MQTTEHALRRAFRHLVSKASGTENAFFSKAGCFFAATGSCAFASFSLYVVLLALKCVQKVVSKSIKILIAALRCVCRFAFFLLLRDSFATLRFGCDSVAALRLVSCFPIRQLPAFTSDCNPQISRKSTANHVIFKPQLFDVFGNVDLH